MYILEVKEVFWMLHLHPDFKLNKTIFFTLGVNTENDKKGGNTSLYSAVIDGLKFK